MKPAHSSSRQRGTGLLAGGDQPLEVPGADKMNAANVAQVAEGYPGKLAALVLWSAGKAARPTG